VPTLFLIAFGIVLLGFLFEPILPLHEEINCSTLNWLIHVIFLIVLSELFDHYVCVLFSTAILQIG